MLNRKCHYKLLIFLLSNLIFYFYSENDTSVKKKTNFNFTKKEKIFGISCIILVTSNIITIKFLIDSKKKTKQIPKENNQNQSNTQSDDELPYVNNISIQSNINDIYDKNICLKIHSLSDKNKNKYLKFTANIDFGVNFEDIRNGEPENEQKERLDFLKRLVKDWTEFNEEIVNSTQLTNYQNDKLKQKGFAITYDKDGLQKKIPIYHDFDLLANEQQANNVLNIIKSFISKR